MSDRLSAEDIEYLRRSCEESGVPEKVTDPIVIADAADILRPVITSRVGRRSV